MPPVPASADATRDSQWHLKFLNIAEAHKVSTGKGVVVAVIDTGVNASHPDLQSSVQKGIDVTPGRSGDGQQDSDGHGTAMAGLIAAHGHGSDIGALGIAHEFTLANPTPDSASKQSHPVCPGSLVWRRPCLCN